MRKSSMLFAGVALAMGLSAAVIADERPDHFKGKSSATLSEAVANFSEFNEQLSVIVARDNLEPADMVKVHELTYTLENALEKIRSELDDLADTLEEVHVASERMDADAVKAQGQKYLQTSNEVIPHTR